MHIDEVAVRYPVLFDAVCAIKKSDGISELFPPQADAINSGYLDGKNILLTIPTSTGKTLISELAAVKKVVEGKGKTLYLVPLKALAMEKYNEFKQKYSDLGIKVAVSVGDYDSNDKWMAGYDIIITSVEKADSILRHSPRWMSDIGLIVADEVHLLDDVSRGPTLEVVLTKLREVTGAQVIGLSATVRNRAELAGWLDAVLVESNFRPVELIEGVAYGNKVVYPKRPLLDTELCGSDTLGNLVSSVTVNGQQSIVFVSSKRGTEAEAERMCKVVRHQLSDVEIRRLEKVSEKILGALSTPTDQCLRLAKVVRLGVAFHHSGLVQKQKGIIEESYRKGYIKCICATTTLAYGMNLPCDFVFMRDVKRFYGGRGSDYIPVLEYKQCVGRSGRVKYSSEGRSVIIGKSRSDVNKYRERFIDGEVENIDSKLGVETALRMHVLSLISSGTVVDIDSLRSFFGNTFYAFQYGDLSELLSKVERVVEMLVGFGFLKVNGKDMYVTAVGRRVSELYIDPVSADMFVRSINLDMKLVDEDRGFALESVVKDDLDFVSADKLSDRLEVFPFSFLQMICFSMEMMPRLSVKKSEEKYYDVVLEAVRENIMIDVPSVWSYEWVGFIDSVKTGAMLKEWIEEASEKELQDKYKVTPGELKVKLDNAEWLLFSVEEFSRLCGKEDLCSFIGKLRCRLKNGIKGELVELVKIKGVGRVKSRKMFDSGLRSLKDIYGCDPLVLAKLVGEKSAEKIKKDLGVDISADLKKQKSLDCF